ncbi:MAG: outer membrane beta-barrel protein [Cyclobacteriaceae bacterium]|nr:outer membrane beta-barrel protein [Cyclobacteriaceae bacterium]MBX2956907.1 outer membrane beta-barrel protein [Cyclobacteriaceae bacterium]
MKKIFLLTLFSAFTLGAVLAQSNTIISYSVGFGTGDLGEFIGKPSFRGMSFDYRKMVNPNVGVGVNFSWNTFYEEKDRATYTQDNISLTGKQYRYSNNFPMLATAAYFLKPEESMNPFVGLGIGTMYTLRNTDMNLYTLEQDAWNFLLQPEVGLQFEIDPSTALHVSLKYNVGFKAGNELTNAQSYLALNVGFALK